MLRELSIQNVAIIEDVQVAFGPGLNVLSGETGAGKSIILGALGLVLGARASAEMVRTGGKTAEVVARFDLDGPARMVLDALGLAVADDELLVRRVVTSAGRSRAYIGGQMVPTSSLRQLAAVLVDYASQHEHRVLLDEARHRGIVDLFGGHEMLLVEVSEKVSALRALDDELRRLQDRETDQRARLDFLDYQLSELDDFAPVLGEEDVLESPRLRACLFLPVGSRGTVGRGSRGATALRHTNRRSVGRIADPDFSRAFFGIWLNEETSVPDLRRKLLGSL